MADEQQTTLDGGTPQRDATGTLVDQSQSQGSLTSQTKEAQTDSSKEKTAEAKPELGADGKPVEKKAEKADRAKRLRENMRDPKWIAEQRANGVPDEAIDIMRMFMGEEPN